MSAFIVPQSLINRIVSFLNRHESDYRHFQHWEGLPVYNLADSDDLDRLASDLYMMNCDAVDQRYRKGTAAKDTDGLPAVQFEFVPSHDEIQVYKSMTCLRYQCSEGDVPERPLYKWLDAVANSTAHKIVAGMPSWQTAEWGS